MLSTYRENSNAANGLLIDPQGRLIACEGAAFERPGVKVRGTPRVTRTDLKTGQVEVLADSYEGKPLVGPNDVTIDGKGRLYFTELNGAAVYRIDGPGKVARILAAPDIQRPNGIQISPDDRKLYLVEANQAQGGARLIRSYDLQPDGTVRNMRVHYDFSPGPQRGRHEHRHARKPLRLGRDEPAARHLRDARHEDRRLRDLAGREAAQVHPDPGGLHHEQRVRRSGHEDALRDGRKTLYKLRTEIAGLPR